MTTPTEQRAVPGARELAIKAFPHDYRLAPEGCQHICICGAEENRRKCQMAIEAYAASYRTTAIAPSLVHDIGGAFLQEARPEPESPSCHVCGSIMAADRWKCRSCGTTTGATAPVLLAETEKFICPSCGEEYAPGVSCDLCADSDARATTLVPQQWISVERIEKIVSEHLHCEESPKSCAIHILDAIRQECLPSPPVVEEER